MVGQVVRQAPADGHTLLMARVGSQVVLPVLAPKTPYRWNDFTLIGLTELNPVVCAVRSESPYRTLKDLSDALRARPGGLSSDVDEVGAVGHEAPATRHRGVGVEPETAVRERVGRDVDDAHHESAASTGGAGDAGDLRAGHDPLMRFIASFRVATSRS